MSFNKYRLKGAYHYEWYETEDWYKQCVDRIVRFCKGVTLDIGCGDGLLLDKLESSGVQAFGIDKDPHAIKLCNERALEAHQYDIETLNIHNIISYMACLNVIEHLNKPEVLKDIIRNNITKGAIIITLEWQGGAFGEDHKHEYTYDELLEFFKEFNPKGFRIKNHPEWIGVEIKK